MSNLLDFQRFSTFVGGIVDRKIRALTLSITASTGYLKSLVTQSAGYAATATSSATTASGAAASASASSASATLVYNSFTSTYLGLHSTDPTQSSIGLPGLLGGFYVRSTDSRVRYISNVGTGGVLTWADATVAADANSVVAGGTGVFVKLSNIANQVITGPVQFQASTLVPAISSWTSYNAVPAVDVNTRITGVNTAITNEVNRATSAESSLSGSITSVNTGLSGEITRATTAEGVLSGRITTNGTNITNEVNRATAAEGVLSSSLGTTNSNLSSEISRAQAAEAALGSRIDTNTSDISAEVTRATDAENDIISSIVDKLDTSTYALFGDPTASTTTNVAGTMVTLTFPGGIIVKIGNWTNALSEGNNYIGFQLAFPNACTTVVPVLQKTSASGNILGYLQKGAQTKNGFYFVVQDTEGSAGADGCVYVAVGT